MARLLCIFGTRPEAIKMAPVIKTLKIMYGSDVQVCITAQHRQMLDQVLALFQIKPDFDLNIMQPNQTLAELSSRLLTNLTEVLQTAQPERILVHGDTTTTFIAALCAFYQKISVGHIEAGLRSHHLYSPWPEEANRRLAGILTDCHFAPTRYAADNLLAEGFPQNGIHITGNTVIDALLMTKDMITTEPLMAAKLKTQFSFIDPNKRLLLVTAHRRESFGQGFEQICKALAILAKREDIQVVFPVHLNPHVQTTVKSKLTNHPNIHLIEPLEYLPFVYLMIHAQLILTDSGGIQEEAPALGIPVLVMRDVTERHEAVAAGTARLVGADSRRIVESVTELLENSEAYQSMSLAHNPYGDGTASQKIATVLQQLHPLKNSTIIS